MTGINVDAASMGSDRPASPSQGAANLFPHLLVAINGRAGTQRDVALGFRIASRISARVTVLFIVTPANGGTQSSWGPRSQDAVDAGERLFRHVRRMAATAGVPCVCRYAFGNDAEMIVREASTAHRCDLVLFNAPSAGVPETGATVLG
ncbi:universal stress protein [Luteibacter sp. SG786]|uniref:universal stress protein n=1 Tax=Luteibacter sp. SG786 TaxID=2587130 RepID=UPI00142246C4|nr:universal stress protein [Luteibacter sp. SG786]NII54999.1 K+-sensing histidine kinase KdpD [Luteibacter sp. SG786]